MTNLRFAIFGTGFWSRFQLAGWQELEGVECVALYNRTRVKAEALALAFGVPAVYDDPEALLRHEQLDFIDVITSVETHSQFVHLAVAHKLPVICQKPMATSLEEAETMVRACREAGVPLFVHENWRWQTPIRQVKQALDGGQIGIPFRARIHYCSSFPVFDHQPFLKELEQFIIVHSSIVPCNADLLRALKGKGPAETTGEDNLKTVRLVFAAYESAASDQVIREASCVKGDC